MERENIKILPPYTHTPGVTIHPNEVGGHMKDSAVWKDILKDQKKTYSYGIKLFNSGFYWEAHVYFEYLWNFHKRVGVFANFLKAMIKLCASGVKIRMGETALAQNHLRAFKRELMALKLSGEYYAGINIKKAQNFELPPNCIKLCDGIPRIFWEKI